MALGKAEGKAEGKVEGKIEQAQEIVCKYLTRRFGMESTEVRNKVQELNDLEILDNLLVELFAVNSREEAHTILWKTLKNHFSFSKNGITLSFSETIPKVV